MPVFDKFSRRYVRVSEFGRGGGLGSIRESHAPFFDVFTWSIKSSVTMRKQYRIKPQTLSWNLGKDGRILVGRSILITRLIYLSG